MKLRTVGLVAVCPQARDVGNEFRVALNRRVCDFECFVGGPERDESVSFKRLGQDRSSGKDSE